MSDDKVWATYIRFNRRLKKLGIEIECFNNMPWIYLNSVNGNKVKESYLANHGFTAFFYPLSDHDTVVEFSDRREVFKIVRKYLQCK